MILNSWRWTSIRGRTYKDILSAETLKYSSKQQLCGQFSHAHPTFFSFALCFAACTLAVELLHRQALPHINLRGFSSTNPTILAVGSCMTARPTLGGGFPPHCCNTALFGAHTLHCRLHVTQLFCQLPFSSGRLHSQQKANKCYATLASSIVSIQFVNVPILSSFKEPRTEPLQYSTILNYQRIFFFKGAQQGKSRKWYPWVRWVKGTCDGVWQQSQESPTGDKSPPRELHLSF